MTNIKRRDFLLASAATLTASNMLSPKATAAETPKFKTTLHKAKIGAPSYETLKSWADDGFEGIEATTNQKKIKSPVDAAKDHLAAEKLGMRIHSQTYGRARFNSPDSGKVAADMEKVKAALKSARGYGADTLLLVPCRIGKMPMPNPWEFDIKFDEKTGHIKEVVKGDNSKFEKYIKAHNVSMDATRKCIGRLIPFAQAAGITIAIENVWSNFCVKPEIAKNLIDSFDSHWVKAYFDIGNHVKYSKPEDWIYTLGKQIVKCHVKDFKLNANGQGGHFVEFREGSVNWPSVRKALDDINYNGWMTIEFEVKNTLSLEEQNRRLDLILAGR